MKAGGSVTVAENTIVFRDYEFVAWSINTPWWKNGEEKRSPSAIPRRHARERHAGRVTLQAVWKRPAELPLQIGGFLYYKKGDVNVDGDEPAPVRYTTGQPLMVADCPFRKDGHSHRVVDGDGPRLSGRQRADAGQRHRHAAAHLGQGQQAVATHRVTYTTDEPGLTGELPASFELYEKNTFIVAENTQSKAGFAFSHWEDPAGNRYARGHIRLPGSETVLRGVCPNRCAVTLTPSCSAGGSITPAEPQSVPQGGTCVFVFLPEAGYEVYSVTVNGEAVEPSGSYV